MVYWPLYDKCRGAESVERDDLHIRGTILQRFLPYREMAIYLLLYGFVAAAACYTYFQGLSHRFSLWVYPKVTLELFLLFGQLALLGYLLHTALLRRPNALLATVLSELKG